MKRGRSDFGAAHLPSTPIIHPTPPDVNARGGVPDLSLGPSAMNFCVYGGAHICHTAGAMLSMQKQITDRLAELRRA